MAARRARRQHGVGRNPACASIAGASVAVHEDIGVVGDAGDVAGTVAAIRATISDGLSGDVGAGGRECHPANTRVARAHGALAVRSRTIGCNDAADARARAVANVRSATRRTEGGRWVRWDAAGADVGRARVGIGGHVGVVRCRDDIARAVALVLVAVTDRLGRDRNAGRQVLQATGARKASAHRALGVRAGAVRRGQTRDARTSAVALRSAALIANDAGKGGRVG